VHGRVQACWAAVPLLGGLELLLWPVFLVSATQVSKPTMSLIKTSASMVSGRYLSSKLKLEACSSDAVDCMLLSSMTSTNNVDRLSANSSSVIFSPEPQSHALITCTIQYNSEICKRCTTVCPGALTELCKRLSRLSTKILWWNFGWKVDSASLCIQVLLALVEPVFHIGFPTCL